MSGVVREAFRRRGHEAWSCDLQPSVDNSPHHYLTDVREVLMNTRWDLMIAHPPCTHLSVSGARWFKNKLNEQFEAIRFFTFLAEYQGIEKIAVENPVGIMSTVYRKPDQYIQPYQFGDNASKKTGLWLKNLPKLVPTSYVEPRIVNGLPRWNNQTDSGQNRLTPSEDRGIIRSMTYEGIANAMATQWG